VYKLNSVCASDLSANQSGLGNSSMLTTFAVQSSLDRGLRALHSADDDAVERLDAVSAYDKKKTFSRLLS